MPQGPIKPCFLPTGKFLKARTNCGRESRFRWLVDSVEHAGIVPVSGGLLLLVGGLPPSACLTAGLPLQGTEARWRNGSREPEEVQRGRVYLQSKNPFRQYRLKSDFWAPEPFFV